MAKKHKNLPDMPNLRGNQEFLRRFAELQNSKNQSNPLTDYLGQEFGDSSNNVKFQSVLEQLGNGNTDISQLLSSFLGAGDNSFTDERWDMLYQYLLGLMSQANQRAYDVQMRDESRLYSTPTNELARLMGAGVSRDAAIQILSGAAGGSSVGSAMIGSGANPFTTSPTGISGTQELARQQNVAGMVFGSLAALGNLMQSGISMAQGIEQVKQLHYQNYFSQQQSEAFSGVQQIANALQTMQTNGAIEPSEIEGLSNADDLIKYLQKASRDNEQIAQLVKSPAYANSLGTSFGRDYFNQYWKSLRESQNEGTLYDHFIKQQSLQNVLTNANIQKIGAEMENLGKQGNLIDQQIIESTNRVLIGESQIQVLNKQGKFIDIQGEQLIRQTDANVNLMDTQAYGQDVQNKQALLNYEYNEVGFPMMKLARQHEIEVELARWQCAVTPSSMRAMQEKWLQDPVNARDAAYLLQIHQSAVGGFAERNPGLYAFCQGFASSGMSELVKVGAGAIIPAVKVLK